MTLEDFNFFEHALSLASPADLSRLEARIEKEPDLEELLNRLHPSQMESLLLEGEAFIRAQFEFRARTKSSIYAQVYGTRGTGKSEVAMAIAIWLIEAYIRFALLNPVMSFGRSASELNRKLAKATAKGVSACLISDESEDEVGTGSATEEQALVGNIDTMRILMHSVIRCSIPYRHGFGMRCDFILEPILQDRNERVNYCVVYIPNPETGKKDAKFLVKIPLHDNDPLRQNYEDWKIKEQTKFTKAGGRRSRLKERLEPFVKSLVSYAKEIGDVPRSWGMLKRHLVFHIDGGEALTHEERDLICQEAFSQIKRPRGPDGTPIPLLEEYKGQTADLQKAIYSRLVERGVPAEDVEMFSRYVLGIDTQQDIASYYGVSQKTVSNKIRAIRQKDIGYAFEDVYAARLIEEGLRICKGGENTPEPDIVVLDEDDTPTAIHSVKCYFDRISTVTIRREKIGAEELRLRDELGIPLYLVYYDIVEDILFEPVEVTEQERFTFRKAGTSR